VSASQRGKVMPPLMLAQGSVAYNSLHSGRINSRPMCGTLLDRRPITGIPPTERRYCAPAWKWD
jgi:hypothetical protein